MLARVDWQGDSRGNFNQIYYSFPQMIAYASRMCACAPAMFSAPARRHRLPARNRHRSPSLVPARARLIELELEGIGILRNKMFR